MSETTLLFELILLLALTAAGLALFERMGLPAIAGFLVVGAIAVWLTPAKMVNR